MLFQKGQSSDKRGGKILKERQVNELSAIQLESDASLYK